MHDNIYSPFCPLSLSWIPIRSVALVAILALHVSTNTLNFIFHVPSLSKIESLKFWNQIPISNFSTKMVLTNCAKYVLNYASNFTFYALFLHHSPFRTFPKNCIDEVCLICAELCSQIYVLYFTPSQNRKLQSFRTGPHFQIFSCKWCRWIVLLCAELCFSPHWDTEPQSLNTSPGLTMLSLKTTKKKLWRKILMLPVHSCRECSARFSSESCTKWDCASVTFYTLAVSFQSTWSECKTKVYTREQE